MKLSEMTMEKLAPWLHVQPDDPRIQDAWCMAKKAVCSATGLDTEEADKRGELTFAAIALASDMIYNPGIHVDGDKANKVVESFIGMHSHNLLPKVGP